MPAAPRATDLRADAAAAEDSGPERHGQTDIEPGLILRPGRRDRGFISQSSGSTSPSDTKARRPDDGSAMDERRAIAADTALIDYFVLCFRPATSSVLMRSSHGSARAGWGTCGRHVTRA